VCAKVRCSKCKYVRVRTGRLVARQAGRQVGFNYRPCLKRAGGDKEKRLTLARMGRDDSIEVGMLEEGRAIPAEGVWQV
jgi:hypothetical protein